MVHQITSDNIEMSPSMTALAEEKLQKLENHLKDVSDDLKSIRVVLNSGPNEQFIARVEATVHGKTYVADETSLTLENALVEAVEDVDRQYLKGKAKKETEEWDARREMKEEALDEELV